MDKEQTRPTNLLPHGSILYRGYERFLALIDRYPSRALMLTMLFAGALGIVKLWIDPPSFDFNWENRWWQIAVNLSRGLGYEACKPIYFPFCGLDNQITSMREPLPVFLFALISRLTGESLLAAAVAGVVVNILIIPALFSLTVEIANRRVGLLAALLWAVYLAPMRLAYNLISGDLFAALFLTVGLIFFMRARKTGRVLHWLAAGTCNGLAILSSSAFLMIALVLAAGLVLWPPLARSSNDETRIRRLRSLAIFTLTVVVMISPWVIRNFIVFHRPVIGSTLAGYYLLRQNHQLPQADYVRFVSGAEFFPVLEEMLERRTDLKGTENEAQMDLVYRQEALNIIRAYPIRYLVLSGARFLMLWFNWKVNEEYNKQNNQVDQLILLQHGLLLSGALVGLSGRIRDSWRAVWPLATCMAVYNLLYMAVMAHIPYIIPIMPLFVSLSAIGIARFLPAWQSE